MSYVDLDAFVFENVPERCDLRSAVIEVAALQRGLRVDRIDASTVLVGSSEGVVPFVGLNGPDTSVVGQWFTDDMMGQRALMARRGIPLDESAVFPADRMNRALRYAEQLGWPVVVKGRHRLRKRRVGASEHSVITNITQEELFQGAWRQIVDSLRASESARRRQVVIEKHLTGEDIRLFVVDGRVVSATLKARASVTGDGSSAISELIRRKNAIRSDNFYLRDFPIPADLKVLDALATSKRALEDVPAEGEQIYLRTRSGLRAGGDIVDVTDEIEGYYKELAVRAVEAIPGLPYAGVSILAPGVGKRLKGGEEWHLAVEIDSSPIPIAHFPVYGVARDMAGAILSHYVQSAGGEVTSQEPYGENSEGKSRYFGS